MSISPDTAGHETLQETWPLPFGVGQGNTVGFAYWGGVLDTALHLAKSKNLQQIKIVADLLKTAYEAIAQTIKAQETSLETVKSVSAYNSDHNTYEGNLPTLGKDIA